MKFHLEIDLDKLDGSPDVELGRILRYWAGSLGHYSLNPGTNETVRDSSYADVGSWRVDA